MGDSPLPATRDEISWSDMSDRMKKCSYWPYRLWMVFFLGLFLDYLRTIFGSQKRSHGGSNFDIFRFGWPRLATPRERCRQLPANPDPSGLDLCGHQGLWAPPPGSERWKDLRVLEQIRNALIMEVWKWKLEMDYGNISFMISLGYTGDIDIRYCWESANLLNSSLGHQRSRPSAASKPRWPVPAQRAPWLPRSFTEAKDESWHAIVVNHYMHTIPQYGYHWISAICTIHIYIYHSLSLSIYLSILSSLLLSCLVLSYLIHTCSAIYSATFLSESNPQY